MNIKKWRINTPDLNKVGEITRKTDISEVCAKLLSSRGIDTIGSIEDFFNHDADFSDPFLMADMYDAVERLHHAIDAGEKIVIYGDYDCDGITSTVMLLSYLQSFGADASYYIPSREGEGYGLNSDAVKALAEQGANLIITVDNGISSIEEAELISELGMDLIITDHHQVPDTMPEAVAIINPHRPDCNSPFKKLCGAGVVFKLLAAMEDGDYDLIMEEFGDLAAIGTIGDIVPLKDENRLIVRRGLELLPNTERLGLKALMRLSGVNGDNITSTGIAFGIVPRINAAGRFSRPELAVELLLSEDEDEAQEIAQQLCKMNTERQKTEKDIFNQALEHIKQNPNMLSDRVLVLFGEGWHQGVIGIVASRLLEMFQKPVILFSISDGEATGSARSVDGFSLYKALSHCSEHILYFGGHVKAAGLTISTDKIDDFTRAIADYARENFPDMPSGEVTADMVLSGSDITVDNIKSLDLLEPFGEGNPSPTFAIIGAEVNSIRPLKEGRYARVNIQYQGKILDAISFSIPYSDLAYGAGTKIDMLVTLDINEYNGRISPTLRIKDIRPSNFSQDRYFAAKSAYEKIKLGEGYNERLKSRIIPTRGEIAAIYKLLRKGECKLGILYFAICNTTISYCKLRLIIDILCELGLAEFDVITSVISLVDTSKKVDLDSSKILSSL